jgi:hypothetical protein
MDSDAKSKIILQMASPAATAGQARMEIIAWAAGLGGLRGEKDF